MRCHVLPGRRIGIGDCDDLCTGVLEQNTQVCKADYSAAPDHGGSDLLVGPSGLFYIDQATSPADLGSGCGEKVVFGGRFRRIFP